MNMLIVDDDPQEAERLRAVALEYGYQVEVAYSGTQALAAMAARTPDCVILDTDMPDMSGLDVLRQIRLNPHLRQAGVLLANPAISDEEFIFGCLYCADAHLGHPLEAGNLRGLLRLMGRNAEEADTVKEEMVRVRFVDDGWSRGWDAEAERGADYSLEAALNAIRQFGRSTLPDDTQQA